MCSDAKNLAWGQKVEQFCDVIFTEASPALDYQASAKAVREPTTMCLDPSFWRPNLPVPQRFRIPRNDGDLLVYHAFGNMDVRTRNARNIKGTRVVRAAVERLQAEGAPVRAIHDGVVAFADTFSGFGNLVIVDHGSRTFSLYGNLLEVAVKRGARLERGQVLGSVGAPPTGPAGLYFELRVDGQPVDPLQWLKRK